jgi:hypothetical protein
MNKIARMLVSKYKNSSGCMKIWFEWLQYAKQSGDRKLADNTDCPQCNAWPTAFARLILVSHPQTQIVSGGQPSSISPACIHLHLSLRNCFLSAGYQRAGKILTQPQKRNFFDLSFFVAWFRGHPSWLFPPRD